MDLPLAKATEKVLGSMHSILLKTKKARDETLAESKKSEPLEDGLRGEAGEAGQEERERRLRLRTVEAAEVRVVRNLEDLTHPHVVWKAEAF